MAFNPTNARAYIQPEEYTALADVVFIVEGSDLPAHSQVLAQHSSVLRGLFLEQEPSRQKPVRLKAPFKDYSVDVATCCLWFMYHPTMLADADFGALGDKLPALLRLANQLDFAALEDAILDYLEDGIISGASYDTALDWASVLEDLHLIEPLAACVLRLAYLNTRGGNSADIVGFRAIQYRDCLSLPAVVALMGAASARAATGAFPTVDAVACWLEGRGPPRPHTFVWHITGYSKVNDRVQSRLFTALGHSWRLLLYPHGFVREQPVWLYLQAEGLTSVQQVPVSMKVRLINVRGRGASVGVKVNYNFTKRMYHMGLAPFVPTTTISDPKAGFLVDDCITLAVDIKELPASSEELEQVSDSEEEMREEEEMSDE